MLCFFSFYKYNKYKLKKTELSYVSNGIKYIKAVIKPDFNIKIPLEVIFKDIYYMFLIYI